MWRRPAVHVALLHVLLLLLRPNAPHARKGPVESPHLQAVREHSGIWLSPSWTQHVRAFKAQPIVDDTAGPPHLKGAGILRHCNSNCSGAGTCNMYTGRCVCKLGRKGETCADEDHFPCNNPNGGWTVSACFGECKDARCTCGKGTKNPGRPLKGVFFPEAADMWQNAISDRDEELLKKWDIDQAATPQLKWLEGYHHITPEKVKSWCAAGKNKLPKQHFPCVWPELSGGPLCQRVKLSVCLNQCSAHGHCDRGMCICHAGWYGTDCSLSFTSSPPTPDSNTLALKDAELRRESEESAAGVGEADASSPQQRRGGGIQFEGNRLRPRIFVYDLPEVFNSRVLQFRRRDICTTREFTERGDPTFTQWQYALDYMLFEWLLHSEHRTTDPEEADYFFVPFLTSCYIFLGDDHPRHRLAHGCRMIATAQASKLVAKHLKEAYPYWDRKGGADHIWVWAWDEGACPAPAAIRASIMIHHWGGRYTEPRTAYGPDNWLRPDLPWHSFEVGPFGMAFQDLPASYGQYDKYNKRGLTWEGHYEERGHQDCHDPAKDIVMPPPYYGWQSSQGSLYHRWLSGRLQDDSYNKAMLFYFAGDLGSKAAASAGLPGGRSEAHYSRGVRQRLAATYMNATWREKGMHVYHGKRPKYLEEMAHSVFCGAMPGDGWSNAYAWAILHGCIPVLIMDDVDLAWSGVLNYTEFSLRIPEAHIPRLYDILQAVPEARIREMQASLLKIWPRFTYMRYRRDIANRMEAMGFNGHLLRGALVRHAEEMGDDAFDTLMEVLFSRLKDRPP